jgi:hypothetical protein
MTKEEKELRACYHWTEWERKAKELEKENAQLKSIAQFQQSSNMKRHFEIQELEKKNKKLESDFRICEQNADTYYDQLTKAKDHIKKLLDCLKQDTNDPETNYYVCQYMDKAEQFLKEIEK